LIECSRRHLPGEPLMPDAAAQDQLARQIAVQWRKVHGGMRARKKRLLPAGPEGNVRAQLIVATDLYAHWPAVIVLAWRNLDIGILQRRMKTAQQLPTLIGSQVTTTLALDAARQCPCLVEPRRFSQWHGWQGLLR